MAKLNLTASPTFKSIVMIPVPGGKPSPVEFVFKGRTKDEFKAFMEGLRNREDVDVILDICSGWDLDDPFGEEKVETMTQSYIGSARAIIETYINQLTAARQGN